MDNIIKTIEQACLKHHDSGETSVMREAYLIVEALESAGYKIFQSVDKENLLPIYNVHPLKAKKFNNEDFLNWLNYYSEHKILIKQ